MESPFSDIQTLESKFRQIKSKIQQSGSSNSSDKKERGGKSSGSTVVIPSKVEVPETKPVAKPSFIDIDNVEWAKESINYLAEKNIVSGVEDQKFYPHNNIKREEYIKILLTALNFNVKSYECSATDVEKESWYYNYVSTAYQLGITTGKGEGSFGIGEVITRQDAAVLLCRAMSIQGYTVEEKVSEPNINDIEEINAYALDSINKLVKANIVKGNEKGNFSPKNNITRAEASKVIYNVLINLNLGGLK